jgi:hypothetical protein
MSKMFVGGVALDPSYHLLLQQDVNVSTLSHILLPPAVDGEEEPGLLSRRILALTSIIPTHLRGGTSLSSARGARVHVSW